ncbi:chromosome condensation protein CrcB [Streptomyces sp. Act143]|nr:chromosome condensation protein CrcB [Streptomyces sp. Act143]
MIAARRWSAPYPHRGTEATNSPCLSRVCATLRVNTVGCAVIGVFMVVITDVWAAHRLVRPLFGTGVLGGFTTFSTYAVDIPKLVDAGRPRTGLAHLTATLLAALAAVWLAVAVTRRVLAWRQGR